MSALRDGLADVRVPEPELVQTLRVGMAALMGAETRRGGGRDFAAERRQERANAWLEELERAVLRR
jgi:hypothetical protein